MTQENQKNSHSSSLLKDTRVAKGLTLDIVHEATKIPMDALKAIEEGYSTRILTPFYYRGFVKIYAEFLGLSIVDVLKEYNIEPPEVKVVVKQKKETPNKPVKPIRGHSPNVFFEQVQEFGSTFWTPKTRKVLLRILAVIVVLFVLIKIGGCVVGGIKSMLVKNPKAAGVVQDSKKHLSKRELQIQEDAQKDEEEEAARASANTVSAQSQNHKVTLAVHAPKDTWIQVKADGKTVFEMTMKKGTVENWEADKQIEISGKNIGNLDLEVNGKDVGQLSSSNRRAKKVVITKDGLTVKK